MGQPITHTQQPITTGASILGIKYKDGVLLAGDTMVAYGSSLRFNGFSRITAVGEHTLVGASGEYSDFQALTKMCEELETEHWIDGESLTPKAIGSYLGRVLYNRRSKVNPLWNQLVIGGVDPQTGAPMLKYVDLQGTEYDECYVATGFGMHLAVPALREAVEDGRWQHLTLEAAKKVLESALKLLFYRDCKASCVVQFAVATQAGVEVEDSYRLDTFWGHEMWKKPASALAPGVKDSW